MTTKNRITYINSHKDELKRFHVIKNDMDFILPFNDLPNVSSKKPINELKALDVDLTKIETRELKSQCQCGGTLYEDVETVYDYDIYRSKLIYYDINKSTKIQLRIYCNNCRFAKMWWEIEPPSFATVTRDEIFGYNYRLLDFDICTGSKYFALDDRVGFLCCKDYQTCIENCEFNSKIRWDEGDGVIQSISLEEMITEKDKMDFIYNELLNEDKYLTDDDFLYRRVTDGSETGQEE